MSIDTILLENGLLPIYSKKEGYCPFSGELTKNRLPSGDFIASDVVRYFSEKKWIDTHYHYTQKFWDENLGIVKVVDKSGTAHPVYGLDFLQACVIDNVDAARFILKLLPKIHIKKMISYPGEDTDIIVTFLRNHFPDYLDNIK